MPTRTGIISIPCILARISSAGSFDENLKRFESEAPPTLMVGLADDLGTRGFDLLKPIPELTSTEVAGIGDRAVLRRGTKEVNLFVASGKNFLRLDLVGETPTGKQEQDLMVLAREALATNFDRAHVARYEVADRALDNDKTAFEADPKNFAIFLGAMTKFDEARVYNLQAAAANPHDADILYIQGVLDWITTDQARMVIRARLGLSAAQPLSGPECADVRNTNREKVEDGIASLSKAIRLRPDFFDAMAYLNVLYRERAEYECDDAAARAADLKTAGEWGAKTAAGKRAAEGKALVGNVLPLFPARSQSRAGVVGGVPGGIPGGQMGGVIGGVSISPPPIEIQMIKEEEAPPPLETNGAASSGVSPQRVRVSAGVSTGLLVTHAQPIYPPLARQARIQGTVVLRAIIGKDGSIESLTLVSGHPMLVPAAIDAVKQWKYKPYLLNGQPVQVDTEVQVNFTLSGG